MSSRGGGSALDGVRARAWGGVAVIGGNPGRGGRAWSGPCRRKTQPVQRWSTAWLACLESHNWETYF